MKKSLLKKFWSLGLVLLIGCTAVTTSEMAAATTTAPSFKPDLSFETRQQIERALNMTNSFRSHFVQTSTHPDAARVEGTMYYQKPGKLRIEYKAPVPYLIVANGLWLIYYDRELEQVTHLPVSETPARFLLETRFDLTRDFSLLDATETDEDITVVLKPREDVGASRLTLSFHKTPETLQKLTLDNWIVRDLQGIDTQVKLVDVEYDVPLKKSLFTFVNPKMDDKFQR